VGKEAFWVTIVRIRSFCFLFLTILKSESFLELVHDKSVGEMKGGRETDGIYNTKGTNFQRNGHSWRLDGYCKVTGMSTYIQEQNLLFWKLDFHGKVNFANIFCLGIEKQNTVGNVQK
jgi:hypothetical protein